MQALIALIAAHSTIVTVVVAYVGLAIVQGLPEPGDPRPVSQKLYSTFYTAAHLLANKAVEKRPGLALPTASLDPQISTPALRQIQKV